MATTLPSAVRLVRGLPWAHEAMHLVVGWFGLVGPAVAAIVPLVPAHRINDGQDR